MRTLLSTTVLIVTLAALVACGKSSDKSDESGKSDESDKSDESSAPTPSPTTDAKAAAAATKPVDAAPAAPETAEDKAAQCARIIDKSWKAMAPGYAKAGVTVTPELEKKYREGYDTRSFLEKCPTVSRSYRECIEAAANPIENADPCNASAGEGEPQLSRPMSPAPDAPGQPPRSLVSSLFVRPELGAAAKKNIVSKLTGSWSYTSHFGTTSWKIAAGGKVTEVETRDGKAGEPKTFRIEPATDTTVTIVYPNNGQTRGFHRLSDTEFLCQGNMMWMPSFVGDGTTFTALKDFDAVFYDNGACEVLTGYGSLLPGTCAFAEREGKRYFDVSYQVPGKVKWRTTDPEPTKGTFLVSGEYLVPEKLLDSLYTKQ
jgi:predicted small lipoprotein YifL